MNLATPARHPSQAQKSPAVLATRTGQFINETDRIMNSLSIVSNTVTMSSREIAELLEKQHANIKISAERLAC